MNESRQSFLPLTFFSLFTSISTLVCCALPALLVSIGMGAAVAGLVSSVPQLIWLSEHKIWVFIFSGLLLIISGLALYKTKDLPCPVDPRRKAACLRGRKLSLAILILTSLCFSVGLFFAFLAPLVLT